MTTSLVRSDNFIPFPISSRPLQGGFFYFFFAPGQSSSVLTASAQQPMITSVLRWFDYAHQPTLTSAPLSDRCTQ